MALVACPKCGCTLSTKATACPHCGAAVIGGHSANVSTVPLPSDFDPTYPETESTEKLVTGANALDGKSVAPMPEEAARSPALPLAGVMIWLKRLTKWGSSSGAYPPARPPAQKTSPGWHILIGMTCLFVYRQCTTEDSKKNPAFVELARLVGWMPAVTPSPMTTYDFNSLWLRPTPPKDRSKEPESREYSNGHKRAVEPPAGGAIEESEIQEYFKNHKGTGRFDSSPPPPRTPYPRPLR